MHIDTAEIRALTVRLEQFGVNQRARAVGRGLHKIAKQGMTEAKRQITAEYNVRAKDVQSRLSVRVERKGSALSAVIRAKYLGDRRRIPIIKFSARDNKPKGVSFRILRKGKRNRFRHAFIATMPNGYRGVFLRPKGGKRLSIKEVSGVDIVPMFSGWRVKPLVIKKMLSVGSRVLAHEMAFELRRLIDKK